MKALVSLALASSLLLLPARGFAQDFDMQLNEVLRLIGEKSYALALEDLRFAARQVQELRLGEAAPLFPEPPDGWDAGEPFLILPDDELWSRRLQVLRTYKPKEGTGKVELLFDFYSPLIPQATLNLNPVYAAGDSRVHIVSVGEEKARLLFNEDTGEGELMMIPGNRLLFTIVGRGIRSREILREFASRVDMAYLKSFTPR